MNVPIQLHKAEKKHINDILALVRSFKKDPMYVSYEQLNHDNIEEYICDPNRTLLLAIVEKRVIGLGTLKRGKLNYQRHLGDMSIGLDPDYRGKGIAPLIVRRMEKEAKKQGITLIKLMILSKNIPSIKLARFCGYHQEAILIAEYRDPDFGDLDFYVFHKWLL